MTYTFNENCTDCTECADKCPTGAISICKDDNSLHCIVDEDLCVNCGHCANICEKEAVRDQYGRPVKRIPENEWKLPEIELSECTGCMLCIEICPTYALSMTKPLSQDDPRSFAFLREKADCMGCGMCADKCPVDAIKMVEKC